MKRLDIAEHDDLEGVPAVAIGIQAGRELAAANQTPQDVLRPPDGRIPFVILEEGQRVESLDELLGREDFIRQQLAFADVDSYVAYVNRFKAESTTLFATPEKIRVSAYLDYHASPDAPGRGVHTATLQLQHSPEWKAWTGKNEQFIKQEALAEFLEDRELDIIEPDGATISECVGKLQATNKVAFKSGVNLRNGAIEFSFVENVEEQTGKGNIRLPSEFKLGVPIYLHSDPVQITARLRFRISTGGELAFLYKLMDVERVVQAAFEAECARVEAGVGIKPLVGGVVR